MAIPDHRGRRPPAGTYRVQLGPELDFDAAAAIAPYLAELGVSHVYLSPILQAAPGSTHGYDVVDPTRVSRDLGGEAGYERLGAALGRAGLGQVLDVVPNHMAITGPENRWWWDVLAMGRASRYAGYFDVDWDSPQANLRDTVLLAVLGDQYGAELEAGNLVLVREGEDFLIRYFDHAYPIDPASLGPLLAGAASCVEAEDPRVELERLAGTAERIPPAGADSGAQSERREQVGELVARLGELLSARGEVAAAVDAEVARWSSDPDLLGSLLDAQHYRLAWWRSAGENLDYRRFFDINDLAAIRVEQPEVFADSHRLVLDWLADGVVDGLRIDHIDGLLDPLRYLERIDQASPGAWVVVEKILEGDEALPPGWPVAGTTGYEWLNRVGDLFTHAAGWERLVQGYAEWTGVGERLEEVVHAAKLEVLDGPLASDLSRLVTRLAAVCERHRRYRDHTRRDLRDALAEVAACMSVYRTYVAAGPARAAEGGPEGVDAGGAAGEAERGSSGEGSGEGVRLVALATDESVLEAAVRTAGMRRADLAPDLLALILDVLLGRLAGEAEAEVALRFQQLTGPVMAKAVEDTAFYRWMPLVGRNEVGGDPGRLDDSAERFHRQAAGALRSHPLGLLALSTHDTKRSEDVRARLSVLAEMPEEWFAAVERWWSAWSEAGEGRGALPPDRNTAWLIAQSIVGAWPIDGDRLAAYVGKATREAKQHTSWTQPDPVYDEAVATFARAAVAEGPPLDVLMGVVRVVTRPGRAVALSQKLLTLVGPGVPDSYQGSELWDLSLVDPDNRRPVDYELRRRLLASLRPETSGSSGTSRPSGQPAANGAGTGEQPGEDAGRRRAIEAWAAGDEVGLVKLWVTHQALTLRAERPGWFAGGDDGAWEPVGAEGPAAEHLLAVRRGGAVALVTRWPLLLERSGGWRDTVVRLPPGRYLDRLGGGTWESSVPVASLLARLPVALLVADPPGGPR